MIFHLSWFVAIIAMAFDKVYFDTASTVRIIPYYRRTIDIMLCVDCCSIICICCRFYAAGKILQTIRTVGYAACIFGLHFSRCNKFKFSGFVTQKIILYTVDSVIFISSIRYSVLEMVPSGL